MSIESVMPSISSCHPLLLLPSIFPRIKVFSSELALRIRWPNIGASASVLPMNFQSWFPLGLTGLISLLSKRLKNLLQHHSSKASVLQHSVFMVQVSNPYMTTGKTIALTTWTLLTICDGQQTKVMSVLFNMLSTFVIAFLPRSKHLLISWLQSLSAVILEPKKVRSVTASFFHILFAMKGRDQTP